MHTRTAVGALRMAYGVSLADGRPAIFPPFRPAESGVMGVTSTGNLWNQKRSNPASARAGHLEGTDVVGNRCCVRAGGGVRAVSVCGCEG